MFCTALVIADNMPRDPDDGEEGIFSEHLWSRESSASNKRKKQATAYFQCYKPQITVNWILWSKS